jgi:hypothetical protein
MATTHFNQTTRSRPEQFVAGLTDFGPGRSELLGHSADNYLNVHSQGPDQVDVTGSRGAGEHPTGLVAITKRIARHWQAFVSPEGILPQSAGPSDSQAPTMGMVC